MLSLDPVADFRVSFFITHQHAMHAEGDIVLPILSVCLSVRLPVCPMLVQYCVKTNRLIDRQFFDVLVGHHCSFC